MTSPMNPVVAITLNFGIESNTSETQSLFEVCDKLQIKTTLMVDVSQETEERRQLWKYAIQKGHDIQPLLSSPTSIKKSKETLEALLKPINPNYQVIACRMQNTANQSYKEIYHALVSEGIYCDSSVDPKNPLFPFSYSIHQPYFGNPYAPQLRAPASEKELVQIPIFHASLKDYLKKEVKKRKEDHKNAFFRKVIRKLGAYYCRFGFLRKMINPILSQKLLYCICDYKPEEIVKYQYFVLEDDISDLQALKHSVTFITLSQMAGLARQELSESLRKDRTEEAKYQAEGSYQAVMGEDRNAVQSAYLQNLIPWDCDSVLDFGCGTGYWTDRIAKIYPWISKVVGIDFGIDFIKKANVHYLNEHVSFVQGNFEEMSFEDGSFDCVYADATLEHAFDINRALQEIYRVLKENGSLIAMIPSDARNPEWSNPCHIWKTIPEETRMRLEDNGFTNIEIDEVNIYKTFSMIPYPPANSLMMFIRAWKQPQLARIKHATEWISKIDTTKLAPTTGTSDPVTILKKLLKREGYCVTQKKNTIQLLLDEKKYTFELLGLQNG